MAVSSDLRRLFSACRILGNGDDRVSLSENEIFCLLHQACADLQVAPAVSRLPALSAPPPGADYYRIPLAWFQQPQRDCPSAEILLASLAACVGHIDDFRLYFDNLATLHKRRVKYQRILSSQPRPVMDQVGPRSLLEFGGLQDGLLASWLIWRKWIYDIDNRSAQETGYLFEPVLASCLGGEAVGSRNSPVKRLNEGGQPTSDGRQIDCYDGVNELAYEFKHRVTIAASGQGRFAEEMSFPFEARAAGLSPVLIVLDPTPSARLTDLINAFEQNQGRHYVGEAAWAHMEGKAGDTMSVFLERYIKPPLTIMAQRAEALPEPLQLSWAADAIEIKGRTQSYRIPRHAPRR